MTCIRLLLVDDHSVMRAGLANMLNAHDGFEVVAEAEDAESALRCFAACKPDVTLLDVSMPGTSGLECLAQLQCVEPGCCVLMLSSSESDCDVMESMNRGARGYVFKSARPAELIEAIFTAYAGKQVLSPELIRRLKDYGETSKLSSRELEVLHLLRKGLSNPDIGSVLGITPRTAKAHVASILEKLGALDRTEAVAIGFERGFLKP